MEWYDIVVAILTGLATAIPLVVQLVKYCKAAVKEKNWQKLLDLVMSLVEEAEKKFENGTSDEKKEWVMMCIKASADTINYDIDMDVVSNMVDALCAMSKKVNAPKEEIIEEAEG